MKKVFIHTLGCRLNSADSALLCTRLQEAGYTPVNTIEPPPELIVVNSCTVTSEASRKSRQAVRKFRSSCPQSVIVVTGCSAELDRQSFLTDGAADLVLTNPEKRELIKFLDQHSGGPQRCDAGGIRRSPQEPLCPFREGTVSSFPFRSRAFIKIQEGCNNFCSYCIVPRTRGRERSRLFSEVLTDCRQAVEAGFPELVLTGVNTCAYADDGKDLGALIHEIAALPGEFRIRLSSTEPAPDNLSLLEVMAAEPKVCRFLHLALQHGCDRILERMRRHYRRADYAAFVEHARKLIPDIHIGSDLIVGFPGESEADFFDSCQFVEKIGFANLHIFTYSKRPGTPAAEFPDQIAPEIAKKRYEELKKIAGTSHRNFLISQTGKTLPVIFERIDSDGMARGWSDNYIELRVPAAEVRLDRILQIKATPESLTGSQELLQ